MEELKRNCIPENWPVLLGLLFLVVNIPLLFLWPLQEVEAAGSVAHFSTEHWLSPVLAWNGDEPVCLFPLLPAIVQGLEYLLGRDPWVLRVPSLLALIGMIMTSAVMAKKAAGPTGAAVASTLCITAFSVFFWGKLGDCNVILVAGLSLAWFSWYTLGFEEGNWGAAWWVALLVVGALMLLNGPAVLCWFYLPVVVMRPWRQQKRAVLNVTHFALLFLIIVLIVMWYFVSEEQQTRFLPLIQGAFADNEGTTTFLMQILKRPFAILLLLMPASVFVWPGFCKSFKPLEKDPVMADLLRAIVCSVVLIVWLWPQAAWFHLLKVVPAMAVLCGIHYGVLIRRHCQFYKGLAKLLWRIAIAVAGLGVVCLLLHGLNVVVLAPLAKPQMSGVLIGVTGVYLTVLAMSVLCIKKKHVLPTMWLVSFAALAGMIVCLATQFLWLQCFEKESSRRVALLEKGHLKKDVPAFFLYPGRLALLERYHLFSECVPLTEVGDLPPEEPLVYILSGESPPLSGERLWETVSETGDLSWRWQASFHWFPAEGGLLRIKRNRTPVRSADGIKPALVLFKGAVRNSSD